MRDDAASDGSRRPRARVRTRLRDERGASVVEFALVIPVLMLLLLGMVDLGKAFNYWIDTTHLANMGARWAAVDKNPGQPSAMTLQQYVRSRANTNELKNGGSGSIPDPLVVCITPGANPGDVVLVEVKSKYRWLPFVGNKISILETEIRGSAEMRMEHAPSTFTAGCS